jgi:hypothetical protein
MDLINRLNELLVHPKLLTRGNADRTARIFYDAAKIIHYRQKFLNKTQLKMKELAGALVLAEAFHSNAYRFEASGPLARNFRECPQEKALDCFEKEVMGEVVDMCGRKIRIDEDAMKSLYKEKLTGRHVIADENYEEVRGKRLPWIRPILENSKAIFVKEEKVYGAFRRSFLYTAIASIPLEPKPQVSYYVVVVAEGGNKELKMVTAYGMFECNKFLRVIALAKPWGRREGERKIPIVPPVE